MGIAMKLLGAFLTPAVAASMNTTGASAVKLRPSWCSLIDFRGYQRTIFPWCWRLIWGHINVVNDSGLEMW